MKFTDPVITQGEGALPLTVQKNSTCPDVNNKTALSAADPDANDALLTLQRYNRPEASVTTAEKQGERRVRAWRG